MHAPLVGHTCTDRLLINMSVHYDWYPLHPPSATTLVSVGEARAQVGYIPKTSKANHCGRGCERIELPLSLHFKSLAHWTHPQVFSDAVVFVLPQISSTHVVPTNNA